jgi:RimJ/RimL family protein N-acetyltransferase
MEISRPDVRLVEPDIERDAPISVQWLYGDHGRNTLQLMGVPDNDIQPTTLEQELQRVSDFITDANQLNWMIEYEDRVVGSVWVDLEPTEHTPSPAIHIMIGDPTARGNGVGSSAMSNVIEYLEEQGHKYIYSRHITSNAGAKRLFEKLGFREFGPAYEDIDSLEWQNTVRLNRQRAYSAPAA